MSKIKELKLLMDSSSRIVVQLTKTTFTKNKQEVCDTFIADSWREALVGICQRVDPLYNREALKQAVDACGRAKLGKIIG